MLLIYLDTYQRNILKTDSICLSSYNTTVCRLQHPWYSSFPRLLDNIECTVKERINELLLA